MNHPNPEEWLPYLDGEASPETAQRLSEHLKNCTQCAAEIEAWQRSIRKLQELEWPKHRHPAPSRVRPAVKWGLAAALVLGLGFASGRWSAPDVRTMKADLATQLRGELRQEMKADLLAAFSPDPQTVKDSFQRQLAREIGQASAKRRDEDRQAIAALLDELQQKQTTDYLSLRKDLETLASTADDRLQQTRWQLDRIAANPAQMDDKQPSK